MKKRIMHWLANRLTKGMLKAVTEEEILIISDSEWIAGKHKLSKGEIQELKEEAQSLRESTLYRLLIKDVRNAATLQRFDQAKTADDMLFGKAMLYNFGLIQKYIRRIATQK